MQNKERRQECEIVEDKDGIRVKLINRENDRKRKN